MGGFETTGRIFVAGHRGMVGSAVVRRLRAEGCGQLLLRTRAELDLTSSAAVDAFFEKEKPEVVILAAAKVGGIHANNTYPAEFIRDNLAIALNVIHAAYRSGTQRLLNLGSTCIYPREAPQPMPEDCLLTGPLEKTNEAYAIAKISALKLCEFYRRQYGVRFHSAMPTNLYGPGDNYHPENSHVLPALIRRFDESKTAGLDRLVIWGTGKPRREFLHVDDLADAVLHLLRLEDPPDLVNVGTGVDCTIRELAETVADVIGFEGTIEHDLTKPDGTPRKLTDISRIRATGWGPSIGLREGIEMTVADFRARRDAGELRG